MALSRAQLVTEIGGRLADVLSVAKMAATDTANDLLEPINDALRALGISQANLTSAAVDLVPDGSERTALAYSRYFVLDRAVDAVHALVDVQAPGGAGVKDSGTVASLERQRDRARAIAEGFGLRFAGTAAGAYAGAFTAVGPR